MSMKCDKIKEAIEAIDFKGKVIDYKRFGSGHINDTFLLICEDGEKIIKYILQRMNSDIFTDIQGVMENIIGVTTFLRKKIEEENGNPDRETLTVICTKDGKSYFMDSIGSYWRAYLYIEDASCYDVVEKPEDFYETAKAFGRFQFLLSEYPTEKLHETIPDFHNTPVRMEAFKKALKEDICGRRSMAEKEIQFIMEREKEMSIAIDMLKEGKLPLRVTHNDTKLNNIMIDDKTREGICVIDLDTVMPGLSINDFGDSIRFGANTAKEDEVDLSKVSLSLPLFEIYIKGFLEGCNNSLTEEEIKMLPMGAKLMTLECGMRFLTDFLSGDTYFKIHRDNHNLDRARTQLSLVADMENKWKEMEGIVSRYK